MTRARPAWIIWAGLLLSLTSPRAAFPHSISGADWRVHFNLPSRSGFAAGPWENSIRDALLGRINALQTNHVAHLATYTFSGNSAGTGCAGPMLLAISNALARGARIHFVADRGINTTSNYWPDISLASLAALPANPLQLSVDASAFGVMHNKLGVFDFGGDEKWVFITSWNFTGGASIYQWNIALELRGAPLFAAYTNETAEFAAGRFHADPAKSHAHDGIAFTLRDAWRSGFVRFAPYPDSSTGGNNAQTDITNLIAAAQTEIFFALNKLTRPLIRDALIAAADRGVMVFGCMPQSDWADPSDDSYTTYAYLNDPGNYAGTNRVHFLPAYSRADYSTLDAGESDLVHTKYLVIDPWGANPVVIHGSANWTDAGLASTSLNDENIVVVRHGDIARFFLAQFKRMTGAWPDESAAWTRIARTGSAARVDFWIPQTNTHYLETAPGPDQPWEPIGAFFSNFVGGISIVTNRADGRAVFRLRRE